MSLTMPIPLKMRETLSADPYMQRCIMHLGMFCSGRVQWHHAFTYTGKRKNELWAIIPLCEHHHRIEAKIRPIINSQMKMRALHFGARAFIIETYPKSRLAALLLEDV